MTGHKISKGTFSLSIKSVADYGDSYTSNQRKALQISDLGDGNEMVCDASMDENVL